MSLGSRQFVPAFVQTQARAERNVATNYAPWHRMFMASTKPTRVLGLLLLGRRFTCHNLLSAWARKILELDADGRLDTSLDLVQKEILGELDTHGWASDMDPLLPDFASLVDAVAYVQTLPTTPVDVVLTSKDVRTQKEYITQLLDTVNAIRRCVISMLMSMELLPRGAKLADTLW